MKHVIPARKKLTALALTQPQETPLIGEYNHILFIDRYFKTVNRWMECYDLVKEANFKQLN